MTARAPARRLVLRTLAVALGVAGAGGLVTSCFSGAGGTAPPTSTFYFPVGMAVSPGGNVLYVVNSDFDLQWNGGTLQSYDLFRLRHDTAELIAANFASPMGGGAGVSSAALTAQVRADIAFLPTSTWQLGCQGSPPTNGTNGSRIPLGEACAPPVDSTAYIEKSAVIGAFASDLQLSIDATRLFAPVRGDATLTWADILPDQGTFAPPDCAPLGCTVNPDGTLSSNGSIAPRKIFASTATWPSAGSETPNPFQFWCGAANGGTCDSVHHTGAVPTTADTRGVTLPGEPFAMAQTPDGTGIAVTHQDSQATSILLSGLQPFPLGKSPPGAQHICDATTGSFCPSMQFTATGMPVGGDGIVAVPHDKDLPIKPCELVGDVSPCVHPAFFETTHSAAELDLLRYYDDDFSSLHRPFLVREVAYTLAANAGGTDSRGIVIDDTPRRMCKLVPGANPAACAQLPARVFFASRTPPSLVIGQVGATSASGDGSYDPDRLTLTGNVPLAVGASKVYLAPIVDAQGRYALRVFVACFDSNQIFVYDPDAGVVENVITVGPGPFAMAFDPFTLDAVADSMVNGTSVPTDLRQSDPALNTIFGTSAPLKTYRFAYVASFTYSYVQVIDLDNSTKTASVTFERPVFTLGLPTVPKGQ